MNTSTITSADGTRLHLVRWDAPEDPKGHVLLIGGLAEHMGRYGHVADALIEGGYQVTGLELRGHGHSGGKRGHVDRWEQYAEDVRAALTELGGDVHIVCHSMGGLVSLYTVHGGAPSVRSLTISNPLLGVRVQAPKIKEAAGRLLSKIWPSLSLGNELDTADLSRDPDVAKRYEADPLVFSTITPRWFTEMEQAKAQVHAAAASFQVPLHMHVSEGDPITNPEDARRFVAAYGGEARLTEWGEALHELFNELEQDKTLAEVVAFLDSQA